MLAIPTLGQRFRTGQAPSMLGVAPVHCGPYRRQGNQAGSLDQIAACPPGNACRDTLVSAVGAAIAAGVAGTVLVFPIPIRMRIDAILIVTSGAAGFTVQDFVVNNSLAWAQGQVFHSAIFAPGADANTAFNGDLVEPGATVNMTVNNLDGAAAQTIWVTLKGPGY